MKCEVMGIVNVTPDSFSDGMRYFTPEEAERRARNIVTEGADVVDIGGESTRPDAVSISWEEEWRRVEPLLERLAAKPLKCRLSIDTYHPETADRALKLGVSMINCVRSESGEAMLELAARYGASIVLPSSFILSRDAEAFPQNIKGAIYLDPMIGFGTTREEDLELLRGIPGLAQHGKVLVGASRKRIVKALTGEKMTGKNLGGNLAIAVWAAMHGASMVRVHDVKETVQALRVLEALKGER